MTTRERTVGRYLRWVLAALALGAGIIHFAVSADHYEVTWMHGTFFAVVAWLQVSWAVGVVLKPTRTLLIAGVVLNAAVIGGWVMSRVWGTPFGDAPWNPEPIGWADGLSVIFEALDHRGLARRARPTRDRAGAAPPVVRCAARGRAGAGGRGRVVARPQPRARVGPLPRR